MKTLKQDIIEMVNNNQIVEHISVMSFFESDSPGEVERILSEATQDGEIKRIYYILPNSTAQRAVYFPVGTKFEL